MEIDGSAASFFDASHCADVVEMGMGEEYGLDSRPRRPGGLKQCRCVGAGIDHRAGVGAIADRKISVGLKGSDRHLYDSHPSIVGSSRTPPSQTSGSCASYKLIRPARAHKKGPLEKAGPSVSG